MLGHRDARPTSMRLKRAFDVTVAAASLLLLSPLLLGVALVTRLRMGSPVLFRQCRAGRGGQPFRMLKFRTMRAPASTEDPVASDAERLTRLGDALRRTSLDELPQLWNVLRGEMSLVGPRPLLVEYLSLYTPEQARRHDVRPGITGWAQVHGRNALTWEQKFALDTWYVEHRTFELDLKILALTVVKVLSTSGISQPGHATAARFTGNK